MFGVLLAAAVLWGDEMGKRRGMKGSVRNAKNDLTTVGRRDRGGLGISIPHGSAGYDEEEGAR